MWSFVAVLLGLQLPMVVLTFAPASFWRALDRQRPLLCGFLWGYSHLFGPRIRIGQPKPWDRSYDEGQS